MALGAVSGAGYYDGYQNFSINGYGDSKNNDDSKKPVVNPGESETKKPGRKSSPAECETCRNRKYQDGSDEGNVSFKAASHVSPEAAGPAVMAHEGEHVANAYSKASQRGGKVLAANVTIKTSICPECGRVYVSGGVTNTMIAYPQASTQPYQANAKSLDAANGAIGANVNEVA